MTETFRCGHPRTPENTRESASTGKRCRECIIDRSARYRDEARVVAPRLAVTCPSAIGSLRLLRGMLKLGAKSGGCLSISAAQCRARLQGMEA